MRLLLALSLACFAAQPGYAQGIMESGGVRAFSAGLGAGLAGSLGHGQFVRQSYETALEAQKAVAAQTKAVNDYCARGAQFEAAKQWAYAETAYKYVLALISHRDGPGSPKSLPVLAHLSKITKAENKLDDAIKYQKTVVALTESTKQAPKEVLSAQRELSSLFINKRDYAGARSALQTEVALFDRYPSLSRDDLQVSLEVYGKVLQQIQGATADATGAVAPASTPYVQQMPEAVIGPDPSAVVHVASAGQTIVGKTPFLEEPKPEKPTPEQEALQKAHLFGADPLPSEVELRHELYGTPVPEPQSVQQSAPQQPTGPSSTPEQQAGPPSTAAPQTQETQTPSESPVK